MNESETRAELIDPALAAAGWGVAAESRVRREFITLGPSLRSVGIFEPDLGGCYIESKGFFGANGVIWAENLWAHDERQIPCKCRQTRCIRGSIARSDGQLRQSLFG